MAIAPRRRSVSNLPFRGALARSTSDQAVATATLTQVTFPATLSGFDVGGYWSSGSPSRFTIPSGEDGYYEYGFMARIQGGVGTLREGLVQLNGAAVPGNDFILSNIANQVMFVFGTLEFNRVLVATDFVYFSVFHDAGLDRNVEGNAQTYHWIRKLGVAA